jgi:hypothetical protein
MEVVVVAATVVVEEEDTDEEEAVAVDEAEGIMGGKVPVVCVHIRCLSTFVNVPVPGFCFGIQSKESVDREDTMTLSCPHCR